ncbi:MAG: hypothetical protein WDO16_05400 [Bacteroidota bacterium]
MGAMLFHFIRHFISFKDMGKCIDLISHPVSYGHCAVDLALDIGMAGDETFLV